MMASAKRALNTGDPTDLVLEADKPYFIIMSIGGVDPTMDVWYHGSSTTQTLVCLATLTELYGCKAPAQWENVLPEDLAANWTATTTDPDGAPRQSVVASVAALMSWLVVSV